MLCKKLVLVLASLFLVLFPGTLVVTAGDQDTPNPSIDKGDEKENVKPGWKGSPGSEFSWDEIRGGSSSDATGRNPGDHSDRNPGDVGKDPGDHSDKGPGDGGKNSGDHSDRVGNEIGEGSHKVPGTQTILNRLCTWHFLVMNCVCTWHPEKRIKRPIAIYSI